MTIYVLTVIQRVAPSACSTDVLGVYRSLEAAQAAFMPGVRWLPDEAAYRRWYGYDTGLEIHECELGE